MSTIFLYGPPASGKSTLGRHLAETLDRSFVDLDEAIAAYDGRTIPEIFATNGEVGFRKIEKRVLQKTIKELEGKDAIVSLGGGTLLDIENRDLVEKCGIVWCREAPSKEERQKRIDQEKGSRPLGDKAEERRIHYNSFTSRVAEAFYLPNSLVVIGTKLGRISKLAKLTIADENAAKLHSEALAGSCFETIPSGEEQKNLTTVAKLWNEMNRHAIGRRDTVAAFGGGVTGDMTGFAAATWMRGVKWINIPTTLLSMVDASTGGKTGCDLPEGKNLIGAFHLPALVVIDTERLETLPARELRNGHAEMIKHEIISGKITSSHNGIPTAKEIAQNLAVKVAIVSEDPLERTGKRLLLNCGHTVGHAVEIATSFAISHGEAVAIGCIEEARLAVRLGMASQDWPKELEKRFAEAGLPTRLPPDLTFESLNPLMKGDKKRSGDIVTFALPIANGDVRAVPVKL